MLYVPHFKARISIAKFTQAGVGMTAMQLPFDFRFVWAGAKLTFPFVRRGIVPEGTSKIPSSMSH